MTGSPLKDCMKVLEETSGDLNKAKDLLRQRGLANAEKKLSKDALDGLVGIMHDKQNHKVTMIEMNCQTDFVANTEQFKIRLQGVLSTLHSQNDLVVSKQQGSDKDFIAELCQKVNMQVSIDDDAQTQTIEDAMKYCITKT